MCGSYHYSDHMQSIHPGQKLTEEHYEKGIVIHYCISVSAKYAIHKEEYLGVLGKEYTAKEQEKRLKIDLTRLKDDAASVT